MSHMRDMVRKPKWKAGDGKRVHVSESVFVTSGSQVRVQNDPGGVFADRLRFLRTHLHQLWKGGKLKSLLITSAFPDEGKSTVALNLAVVLAERGKRKVLLIEGDLHYPTVTDRLELGHPVDLGLAECLAEDLDPFAATRLIEPINIYLLPAGLPSDHPTELLQSDRLAGMMQSFREYFDWVIVDSPPVQPLSDALLLRQCTDATLLVMRAGRTASSAVDNAVSLIGKKNILGMVLNGAEGLEQAYTKYYGSYPRLNYEEKAQRNSIRLLGTRSE